MTKRVRRPSVQVMLRWLLAALLIGAFAACTQAADAGIPTASDSQGATSATTDAEAAETNAVTGDLEDAGLAYSRCMRENGVPDFPDPDPEGRLTLRVGPNSPLNPNSPEFQQAEDTCRHLQPAGRAGANGDLDGQETMLEFARCMRENGIPDYPDPDPNAGPGVRIMVGPNSNLDPNDPKVQAALEICEAILQKEVGGETE